MLGATMEKACFLDRLFIFMICVNVGLAVNCKDEAGNLQNLKQIVVGRCLDYQLTINPDPFSKNGLKNCTELWDKFSSAFRNSSACNITIDSYTDFISAADTDIDGRQLYNSGVYDLAQKYSYRGYRYKTLETTLIGYMMDGLKFCGQQNNTGSDGTISDVTCPRYNIVTCPLTAVGSFWVAASRKFASHAEGHIYVLLNATRTPIFKNTSYFKKYELPEIRSSMVTQITLLLINDFPERVVSPCKEEKTVQLLHTLIKNKGIAVKCIENQRDLVFLRCVDSPTAPICNGVLTTTNKGTTKYASFSVIALMAVIAKLLFNAP